MPIEVSWRGGKSVQDWIMLVCGALLFISPWAMGFAGDMAAARSAWVGAMMERVLPSRFTYCRVELGSADEAAQLEAARGSIAALRQPLEGRSLLAMD